ncbi:primosomal protein N' [Desulfovibrio sp. 3_1_syn3]|uniref:replication restart helicase PriA n=1 Tax=Desulfovibrio sp. 3_1_syn3 TaxID=457398 RepID=UPI0001E12BF0|nr:primosomal protein N' [Desulfovibrio sp. 3_1_syn3]EFL85497.1 primosomal protein N' [Desulfovibrio sp. 3_1_syn3]
MYASVALLSPPYACLTYALPPEFPAAFWQTGLRLAVPLGRGEQGALRAAVLLRVSPTTDLPENVACKTVCWPLENEALLPPDLLALALDLARRQGVEPGHILGHVLPQGLRSTRVRLHRLEAGRASALSLRQIREIQPEERRELAQALCAGAARMLAPGADAASEEFCLLRADPPWPVRPSAARQIEVLEYLHEHGAVSRRRLLQNLGQAVAPALQSLLKAGHLALTREGSGEEDEQALLPPPPTPFCLNADQEAALAGLRAALGEEEAASRLLYGVTGSGKTAVYLELAKMCLAQGKSLLLLAPEVALAHKLRRDAACSLPDAPLFFYHGYQSPARREATFRALAARREPCLVVGTRSALFLPVPRLGCVVLDEEHDGSFKQDESLSYQAKEVAWFRMAQTRGLLLLGSATPDVKTFYAAESGHLPLLRLPSRVGGKPLPPVELIDISTVSPVVSAMDGDGLLAPQSEAALRETLDRGEQAVVLLNRRGYAPLMYCLDCNSTLRCPQCEIGLTYHKGREKLVCHYCGYTRPFPSPCPQCKGMNFLPLGEGTERLAERLSVLAGRPVLRLDRDSTRRPGRMEDILAAFARQEAPILVGTQMLSKGHHFPQVTLAVVADGDLGLNLPDYRAAERTFQLLVQSAGRAGRGEKPGRVLIQTRDVSHYCWQYVQTGDYEGFYAAELARRRLRRYPPFVRLALIRMSFGVEEKNGPAALNELATALRARARELDVQMLGPAPAPLALLRGRRRFHCLLKAGDWQALRRLYFFARSRKASALLRLFLDLDPVNML